MLNRPVRRELTLWLSMQLQIVLITFQGCCWHFDQAEAWLLAEDVVFEEVAAFEVDGALGVVEIFAVVEGAAGVVVTFAAVVEGAARAFCCLAVVHAGGNTAVQKACAIA